MMVVGPDGALVTVYDKHHLYCTVHMTPMRAQ
jgi:predicted amidohydrolase